MSGASFQGGGEWLLRDASVDEITIPEECAPDQLAMARAAAEFMEGEVLPRTAAIERLEPGLNRRLMATAGELGLLGAEVEEQHGGLGLDLVTSALLTEQLGRQASFAVTHGAHSGIGTLPLVYFGTDEQKRRYLPRLVRGEMIGAFALSEAGYGSDALGAATRASLSADGSHYVLNGTKMWTSNAGFADLFTLFAQVDPPPPGLPAGARTFSAFLVERGFPGVSIGREEHKLGIKGSSTCRVLLEDARVPAENLLFEVGRGHSVALNVLNAGRLRLGVGLLGPAKDLLRISARYAGERRQMGRPIGDFGLVQHKLAEQAVRLYAVESACYRVCGMVQRHLERLADGGSESGEDTFLPATARALEEYLIECAMMKVQASEMIDFVVDEAVQIHGGYGYTEEFPVARAYRDARINRIFEGTNEINRLTIAGTLLRRAQRGRLPLLPAIQAAGDELLAPALVEAARNGPLGAETQAVDEARKLLLAVAGAAGRRFGECLAEQQEVLGCLADMAIDLFAAQSTVLRARKLAAGEGRRLSSLRTEPQAGKPAPLPELAAAMARVFTADALERMESAARRVLAAVAEGDGLRAQLALLRRFSRRVPADTIALRRTVAEGVRRAERYPLTLV